MPGYLFHRIDEKTGLSTINTPISLDNPQNTLQTIFRGTISSAESSSAENSWQKNMWIIQKN